MPDTLAQKIRAKYPGVYDDLSDTDLEAKVTAKYPGVYDDIPKTEPSGGAMNFAVVNGQRVPVEDPNTVGTAASHYFSGINPVQAGQMLPFPKAAGGSGMDNPLLPSNIAKDMHAVKKEADARWEKGDYPGAVAKYLESFIPILGPMMSHQGNELEQGKYAAFIGDALALATNAAAPEIAKRVPSIGVPAVAKNPNPVEAAAVEAGQARGIPVDAATVTGNRFVRAAQAGADNTPIGAMVAERAKQAQGAALERVGGEIANQVHPSPVTAEQAGAALKSSTQDLIRTLDASADQAYGKLRSIEAQNPMPVTVTPAKQALKPIYDQLKREAQLVPLMGDKGRALVALDRLMTGPEVAPVSVVDGALSDLKSMARGAAMPELRSQGQGLAAAAVKALEDQVQSAVKRAGPDAMKALEQGRSAVKTKAAVAQVLEEIQSEPVKAYRSAIAPKDTAVAHLRQLQQVAPEVLPQVGRAWLEDALNTATAQGGFEHAAKLDADWRRLGPQTKQLIFGGPDQVRALDQYFLLAKKLAESPNPSKTALSATSIASGGLIFTNPAIGVPVTIGAGAMSKILRNPTALRLMTKGLTLSLGPGRASRVAAAAGAADVIRAAREAGVTMPIPAAVGDQERSGVQP